jgi:hypothetical protein
MIGDPVAAISAIVSATALSVVAANSAALILPEATAPIASIRY